MSKNGKSPRVLIVDDNRDGADALGMLVETLGNQVHVTYSGTQALDVATVFRADLLLIDLVMPDMDGCRLAKRFRELPMFAHTKLVAVTGHKDSEHAALAMKAGFDTLIVKPVSLAAIKEILASIVVSDKMRVATPTGQLDAPRDEKRLSIDEARRIRADRKSKTLTRAEGEAAIGQGVMRFQKEYMGWKSERIHAHFIKDLLVVRAHGTLTQAERQLGTASVPAKGRDLIKEVRKQLLELARPMLESLIHEVAGVKAISMHHDISTVTGEEVVLFSLAEEPRFE
jgi:CheY-like chemotaxis protein